MTLSALSGSAIGGLVLGLAYAFGMVLPLFVMALLWDRFRLGERRFLRARPVRIRLGGRVLATNTINVAVAAAFAVMGGFVIKLAGSGEMTGGPGFQVAIGNGLAGVFGRIEEWVAPVPEAVLGLGVLPIVMNTRAQITADLRANGVRTPFLLDDGTASTEYGTLGRGMHAGLPGHSFVLIDKQGRQRWYGEYPSMWLAPQELLDEVRARLS